MGPPHSQSPARSTLWLNVKFTISRLAAVHLQTLADMIDLVIADRHTVVDRRPAALKRPEVERIVVPDVLEVIEPEQEAVRRPSTSTPPENRMPSNVRLLTAPADASVTPPTSAVCPGAEATVTVLAGLTLLITCRAQLPALRQTVDPAAASDSTVPRSAPEPTVWLHATSGTPSVPTTGAAARGCAVPGGVERSVGTAAATFDDR